MKSRTNFSAKLNIVKEYNIFNLQYLDFFDESFFLVGQCYLYVASGGVSLRLNMSLSLGCSD